MKYKFYINFMNFSINRGWGLGIGDWGLGIGDWDLNKIKNN